MNMINHSMKWEKLGKIFDPTEHKLANNCVAFAQSPQVLILDDCVRIYFSTRERDENGKFISHVAYVEMDRGLSEVRKVSDHEVISMGALGCYDEHGIFPFHVFKNEGKIFGFISGWSRRTSVDVETSIGLAMSEDNGLTFQRVGDGPILSSTLNEPFLVGDPFVLKINETFHMWYIYGIRWVHNKKNNVKERVYKIGHASSFDAVNWKKTDKQLIEDKLNSDECMALPTVLFHKNVFHMVFCYRQAIGFRNGKKESYKLGYAISTNGIDWERNDNQLGLEPTDKSWDSDMMCYPHIFHLDDEIYLMYNGNEFGKHGFGLAKLESM